MKRPIAWVLCLSAAWLMAPGPFAARADAVERDEVLDELAERMGRVDTLHQHMVIASDVGLIGMRHTSERNVTVVFQRPDRLVVDLDYLRVISDGRRVYMVSPEQHRYRAWPLDEPLAEVLLREEIDAFLQLWPALIALISDQPRHYLDRWKAGARVRVLPDEVVDGASCRVFRFPWRAASASEETIATTWMDREYGVVRRMTVVSGSGDDAPAPRYAVRLTFESRSLSVNEPVDEHLFRAPSAEQMEEVDTIPALFAVDEQ